MVDFESVDGRAVGVVVVIIAVVNRERGIICTTRTGSYQFNRLIVAAVGIVVNIITSWRQYRYGRDGWHGSGW